MWRIDSTSPTMPALEAALATEHIRDLRAAAARHQLISLARGCRPAAWQRGAIRLRTALTRLGTSAGRGRLSSAPVCAAC